MTITADLFECKKCGECCKGYGGTFVTEEDVDRISRFLGITPRDFLHNYCQRSGKRPVIKSAPTGYCVFWDRLCTIHRVKPRMCRIWPFIDSLVVDSTNWDIIQSNCPGVQRKATREELAACVEQTSIDYEKHIDALKGSARF